MGSAGRNIYRDLLAGAFTGICWQEHLQGFARSRTDVTSLDSLRRRRVWKLHALAKETEAGVQRGRHLDTTAHDTQYEEFMQAATLAQTTVWLTHITSTIWLAYVIPAYG